MSKAEFRLNPAALPESFSGEDGLHAERRRYYRMTPLGSVALRAESERLLRAVHVAQERLGT